MSKFCNRHGSTRLHELIEEARSLNLERERLDREAGLAFSDTRKLLEGLPDFDILRSETSFTVDQFLLRAARCIFSRPISPHKSSSPRNKSRRRSTRSAVIEKSPVIELEQPREAAPSPEKIASAAVELMSMKAIATAKLAAGKWGKRAPNQLAT